MNHMKGMLVGNNNTCTVHKVSKHVYAATDFETYKVILGKVIANACQL